MGIRPRDKKKHRSQTSQDVTFKMCPLAETKIRTHNSITNMACSGKGYNGSCVNCKMNTKKHSESYCFYKGAEVRNTIEKWPKD